MRIRTAFWMPGVGWFLAIIIGAIAGWIAEKVTRSDMGIFANIVIGIIGALIGGWLAGLLNIHYAGFLGSLVVATVGAIILILIYRAIRGRTVA
ncbi:Uncharacterized membrane protein YeaQ/YmgE, transglycosylase-associated protein family [Faunimonas pinastri]|uniref:Uncharacterized membrane protein YeaQ/YmgE, transglycosylase-associated protein family n=1 Tax=Faunimonas pinastri TaxID=1855383 RepID=A0A1H9N936_9HYPH|nr:GlsB/YeaQ/YmgE family stress response membrane protein [Faunimonas pinastri]SER31903.1 Uncharacterized membrane protein YeaQ/YmgE, transglycosylase-associated protein family [Faunimonas pinastri]